MSTDFLNATAAACLAALIKLVSSVHVRWAGCAPNLRQRIYFANHTSHLDAPLLWAALDPEARALTRPVAARDYWTANPARRYLAGKVFRAVMIDRRHVSAHACNPIEPLLAALGDGCSSLILFPEGTRGKGPEAGTFKGGLYHLARHRPDVELVPTFIEKTNRLFSTGEMLPVPPLGALNFGAPLTVEHGETKAEFLERARAAVNGLRVG